MRVCGPRACGKGRGVVGRARISVVTRAGMGYFGGVADVDDAPDGGGFPHSPAIAEAVVPFLW